MFFKKSPAAAVPPVPSSNVSYLYSVKDIATDSFGAVFEAPTDAVAMRLISQLQATDTQSLLSLYASDYQLFRLGMIDRDTGQLTSVVNYISPLSSLLPKLRPASLPEEGDAERAHNAGGAAPSSVDQHG